MEDKDVRHAYLIMVHEYTLVLERLIQLLDDENNGIYIHIDRKSRAVGKSEMEKMRRLAKRSEVFISRKYKVFWGSYSLVRVQMHLLGAAVKSGKGYDYFHLLSGADLPIKSRECIQKFFEENNGREFIHFGTKQYQNDIQQRYNVYHLFAGRLGRNRDKKFWVDAETYSLAIQRRLSVDRTRKLGFSFYGGANWFSITGGLALHIVENYNKYKRAFYFSQNADEAVVQTVAMDSPYRENIYNARFEDDYNACVRYIDWDRGSPYMFRREDFDVLMASKCMFARKFDENIDRDIIDMVYRALGEGNGK